MYKQVDFSELIGKTLSNVEKENNDYYANVIIFTTNNNEVYKMFHQQDCCESVSLEEIIGGTLEDLIGEEILNAYESSSRNYDSDNCESSTWTFYTIRTNKNTITLRWYGTSNGYYSERVDFYRIE